MRRFMYQTTSHDEAYESYGVQGTGLQTGVPAACAASCSAKRPQSWRRECWLRSGIDPAPFLG